MKKWLILGLRQEIYKRRLEHFVVPGRKELLTETNEQTIKQNKRGTVCGYIKRAQEPTKTVPSDQIRKSLSKQ